MAELNSVRNRSVNIQSLDDWRLTTEPPSGEIISDNYLWVVYLVSLSRAGKAPRLSASIFLPPFSFLAQAFAHCAASSMQIIFSKMVSRRVAFFSSEGFLFHLAQLVPQSFRSRVPECRAAWRNWRAGDGTDEGEVDEWPVIARVSLWDV